jgi:hypothetical protein
MIIYQLNEFNIYSTNYPNPYTLAETVTDIFGIIAVTETSPKTFD